ncbi:transposase [Candidatus Micrarchaeota archaeon]|nr:transposase [Candidatus Micrarchaeota archaeon]
MLKTIQTVLDETAEQRDVLLKAMDNMSQAQNEIVESCYEHKDSNCFRMHKFVYHNVRKKFKLPAQLAIIANKYACVSVKRAVQDKGKRPKFKGTCIHYDKRSSNIFFKESRANLLTLNGRLKVNLKVPKYFQKYVDWDIKESNLVLCKDRKLRLMISIERNFTPSNKTGNIIGVDRGINNLIATSENWLVDGKETFRIKQRYVKLRSRLQSKGTRSARRHLKKVSGKEKRFMRNINHCISKRLIEDAGKDGVIVLENLKGIRYARHRRKQNWLFSNWAFHQLQQFLEYKGEEYGVAIEYVRAKNTSKTCSVCGSLRRGQRIGDIFRCKACKASFNADINASFNILHRYTSINGLSVNQPIAPTCG